MYNEDNAQKFLEEWQHKLRLDDWSIELVLNCTKDMVTENCNASVYYCESLKIAKIHVLASEYIIDSDKVPFNIYKTILHELLHVKCSLLDDVTDIQSRILHQIIDDIAKGIAGV